MVITQLLRDKYDDPMNVNTLHEGCHETTMTGARKRFEQASFRVVGSWLPEGLEIPAFAKDFDR